jgi:hypothetical protein
MKPHTAMLAFAALASAILVLGPAPSGGGPQPAGPQPAAPLTAPADLRAQLRTAIQHAGFAAGGDSLGYVRLHLGHALNCIEGPAGKNFDRAWGNVCLGQGSGILTDLRSAPGGTPYRAVIEHADALAAAGVAGRDLGEVKAIAKAVGALLTVIADGFK